MSLVKDATGQSGQGTPVRKSGRSPVLPTASRVATDAAEATEVSPAPRAKVWPLALATLVVVGLLATSLFVGAYDVTNGELGAEMMWITRVPRTVALLLAGAAMAASGVVMQMLTQNRFVDATTSGTTEWASLGLLLTAIFAPAIGLAGRMAVSSAFAFVGAMTFMVILRRVVIRTTLVVPLIGIMLGAVVSAVTTFLAVQTNLLQMLGTWFMGSFTSVVRGRYEVLWVVAIVTLLVFLLADRITVAGLGKEVATSVGMRYETILIAGTALVAVAAGVTTVVVGFLPFLGLVVPNAVAMIRGDNVRSNLPWVCLGGVALVTVCDLIGRTVRAPFEVPVSMVLGLVGCVVFIAILMRSRYRG
ncbi:ABC transporter permease [Leucobacter denitrificans]|uniref:Iron chelate uptake ABC transporter family permease subunit n=1 Tax=Leucobacter denitrificans TaxID=683042 RepID=A0A7G9S729_9MICO|nr:iron chelate uptake ABC transporter family permease subunit [Leucobacter denitrificans]QNN63654.1 iron chelate uptake ABC transporter family permease subunit [Leucobacter denitrificans]